MSVSYLAAHKGGIQMYSDTDGLVGYGKSPEMDLLILFEMSFCYEANEALRVVVLHPCA